MKGPKAQEKERLTAQSTELSIIENDINPTRTAWPTQAHINAHLSAVLLPTFALYPASCRPH
eukprot:scaffold644793_cov32-Prasinocladus_malaysianus.AAC.1